jgi:hypothetical protein
MKKLYFEFSLTLMYNSIVFAQPSNSTNYELTGTVSFDVSHMYGFLENAALTIGDGGTGPYKAVMVVDKSLTYYLYAL